MKVSIILLTLNAGERFKHLLKSIYDQSYKDYEVILIDSCSTDNTIEYAKKYPINILIIDKKEFGHGKTRNLGAQIAKGEYVIYLTQDAIPTNNMWLENLIKSFDNPEVAGTYSRQIPNKEASSIDKFNYDEDYPCTNRVINKMNGTKYNVIFSDVSSAVRRSVLLNNPYPENIIVSEDLGWAIDVITKGYQIVYSSESKVHHSHAYSLTQIFRVTFDQGVSFNQIFTKKGDKHLMKNNKKRVLRKYKYLFHSRSIKSIPYALTIDLLKLSAIRLGSMHASIPKSILRKLSNTPNYWS